ncbi:MAG: hypothetical protein NT069_30515, partial [Planctomycetota bacterium]|nr:hypothetical protein [Planctomycetota bacterium]
EEISKAVNADLMTAQATLQIRFPVIAVFTGLQAEPGFRELMRRVGPEKSKASRFGMGYDLRAPASSPEMESFASHVCGVFEDWVYGLFREDQVLKRPGNSPLFALLCRVRSGFKSRLARILSNGFGYSERTDPEQAPYFFSGCYFVATGNSADQRAFSGGILEKIDGEQDRLEWNSAAVREDQSVRRLGLVATIAALLLALLFPILVFKNSLFAKTAGTQADTRQSQAGERGASSAESAPRTGKPIDGSPTDDSKRSPEGK